MLVSPVTLEGRLVRLEPLQMAHAAALYAVGQDLSIWRYMRDAPPQSVEDMERWIAVALRQQQQGNAVPFCILDRTTEKPIGSTRYLTIEPENYGLEIGYTWLTSAVRRTGINTECKYLLLRHAFEVLHAIRVQLKTDSRNETSQRAIERLEAVKEGTLRNHVIMHDGYYRHSVYYSIIENEWPTVKARLAAMMNREY